eukprot:2365288-Rhodomonas_salina.4
MMTDLYHKNDDVTVAILFCSASPFTTMSTMRSAWMPNCGSDLSAETRCLLTVKHRGRRCCGNLPLVLLLVSVLGTRCDEDVSGSCSSDDPENQCTKLEKSKVSVLTPTRAKTQRWHPLLYESFTRQTYRNK